MANACLISNTSIEPLTLPAPLYGVIAPGRSIVMNFTAAELVAAAPSLAQGAHIQSLPSTYAGSFDAGYGILGGTTGGTFAGNLLPATDDMYDIGSETAMWGTAFFGGVACGNYRGFSSPGAPEYGGGISLSPGVGADTGIGVEPGTSTVLLMPAGGTNSNLVLHAKDSGRLRLQSGAGATILAIEAGGLSAQFVAPARAATVTANAISGTIGFQAADTAITVNCDRLAALGIVLATLQSVDATMTSVCATVTGPGVFVLTGNAAATGTVRVAFLVINPAS